MPSIPTAAEIQYMEKQMRDDIVPRILAVNMICTVAASIGVAMRLVSRYIQHAGIKADDLWMLASLAFFTGSIIDTSVGYASGSGKHILLVTNPKFQSLVNIVSEGFYCACMLCIKTSILSLYRRIFPQQWFRNALLATGTFNLLWFIAAFFAAIFQCIPISSLWDPATPGYCINFYSAALALGVITVATDFVILTLPMPLLWQIQTSTRKKWLRTIMFMLGGCACLVSIIRLPFLQTNADSIWDGAIRCILSTVELCIGILAACGATWGPLFSRSIRPSATSTTGRGGAPRHTKIPQGKSLGNAPEKVKMPEGTKAQIRDDDGNERPYVRISEPETTTNKSCSRSSAESW